MCARRWKMLIVLSLVFRGAAWADVIYDLSTPGSSVTVNGAIFSQGSVQPAGTGVIQPFLRIKANGTEFGYNTDQSPHPPLDDQPGHTWTHSVLLSSIPVFTVNGHTYYQFLLDINQSQAGNNTLLSLDVLQFYTGTKTSPVCCPGGGDFGTVRWNLDAGNNNYILLRSGLSHGSGSSDMYAFIPTSAFAGDTDPYLYLYSGFGINNASNGGFEEWAYGGAQNQVQTPEPSSWILLSGGMLTLFSRLRRPRALK